LDIEVACPHSLQYQDSVAGLYAQILREGARSARNHGTNYASVPLGEGYSP
jgi:hypothetical protein